MPDEILTWVMLYWISDAGPVGSLRYYKEAMLADSDSEVRQIVQAYSNVPLGVSLFPKELFKFPAEYVLTHALSCKRVGLTHSFIQ